MAFWGVEVKPGKPYTHRYQSSHGRLRICQATLGNCDVATRTVLQCNVGNNIPIKLCSFNPKLAEMCHLEVELEEVDDVVFSVIGQSSIHLSGYYIRASGRSNAGDDESESYGEDIGQSDTDEDHDASEDTYESDFIDDGDVEVHEDECDSIDDGSGKQTGKAERRRRLKKYQVDSTDDDSPYKHPVKHKAASIFDIGSDDEDDIAKSVASDKKDVAEEIKPPKDKHDVLTSVSLAKKDSAKVEEKIKPPNVLANDETQKRITSAKPQNDEDNTPISVVFAKKESANVAEEMKPPNIQENDKDKKKSSGGKKRKGSAIGHDSASPMDITDTNAPPIPNQDAENKKKPKKKMKKLEADGENESKITTLEDGLIIEDLSTGNLDAKLASNGSKVYIKYTGMLKDGKIVESSDSEKPYKFKLGAGKVIRGWDVGICGMRVGGKRRITVPPSMCCGDKSVGAVPKNSSVIYEVELVKVK